MSSQDSELRIPGQRQYRVGGLEPDSNLNQLALHANVDLKNPHADASEGTSTNGEKSQEELEQEQRQRRFKELVDSGIIDPNRKQQPPGKIYTLPVVKPKLM
ncbi:hypothetical protein BGZ76_004578 [Entomortierella beljakovae]|nr:hypothetical protein BGZ76_004578 [Entomortierella beljakovae]